MRQFHKKNHSYEIEDWKIPIELVIAYEVNHEVKASEFVLLARIEHLAEFGKGCCATNEWLADKQGCGVENMRKMIKRLKDREILFAKYVKVKNKPVRYLSTKWSHGLWLEAVRKENARIFHKAIKREDARLRKKRTK